MYPHWLETEDAYIVAICGYEGIEQMFGPLSANYAVDLAKKLKDDAPVDSDRKGKKLAKDLEVEFITYFTKDQVCIMGSNTKDNTIDMKCRCDLLPENYRNEKPWLH